VVRVISNKKIENGFAHAMYFIPDFLLSNACRKTMVKRQENSPP
jgi:hypothetical protein